MQKKSFILVISAILVIGAGVVAYGIYQSRMSGDAIASQLQQSKSINNKLSSQVSDAGGVTVTITPRSVLSNAPFWEFDVVLSTHTQELGGYNLAKLAALVDERGVVSRPTAWIPDATEGHHIGGILRFARPSAELSQIEMTISDIGGVATRSFRWNSL